MLLELWIKAKVLSTVSLKKFILKVSSTILMEHFLCDDLGGVEIIAIFKIKL